MSSSSSSNSEKSTPVASVASNKDSDDESVKRSSKSSSSPTEKGSEKSSAKSSAKSSPSPKAASDSDSDKASSNGSVSKQQASRDSDKGSNKNSDKSDDDDVIKPAARVIGNVSDSNSDSDEGAVRREDIDPDDPDQYERRLKAIQALSDDEDEGGPERKIINEELPILRFNLGGDDRPDEVESGEKPGPTFVKMPNFLSVEPKPFHPEEYQAEVDDDDVLDEEGRSRMKLKVENTIRWRNVKDEVTGELRPESNARIVKWSDGTMSMFLGDEIFEVQEQAALPNMHLFLRLQGLQGQAVFRKKMVFRPYSTDTLTHRKITMGMADKSSKVGKVKLVGDVGVNPEKERLQRVKEEEGQLRANARKLAAQRRSRERARDFGLSSGFLEGDESDEGDVGAVKRSYNSSIPPAYYSDESDEEKSRKNLRDAKVIVSDDEDEPSSSKARQPKRRIIDSDDED